MVFSSYPADWDGAVDRIFAGSHSRVLDQDEGQDIVPGLVGRWGGDRDSVCSGELQWIEASDVYSSDLSAFGVGTGDLVEWAGLSPLRKNPKPIHKKKR